MNKDRDFLGLYFSDKEIDLIEEGYTIPLDSNNLDFIIYERVVNYTLGKICILAAQEKSLPIDSESIEPDSMTLYSLKKKYSLSENWNASIDFKALSDEVEDEPISNPDSILSISFSILPKEPIPFNIEELLRDFSFYDVLQYTRRNRFDKWTDNSKASIEDQVDTLHIIGQKI